MRNLKKVLALMVVLAMVIGVMTATVSASKFTDVDNSASYAEAVSILSSLGIFKGYEDNTFKPDATITRAEVAAIVVRTLGLEDAAAGAVGPTQFSDVAADHWASGYINLATQKGIVAGYGDGTFNPSGEVKYEQVVKMIVAALGYTPKAEVNGGYPSGYLVVASQEGITKGATGSAGENAKRSVVARLVFNSLEVPIMDQTTYVAGGANEWAVTDKTLLTDYLDVTKVEGVVTSTYLSGEDIDKDNPTVTITLSKDAVGNDDLQAGDEVQLGIDNAPETVSLIGYRVIAYYQEDENSGEDEIVAIAPKSSNSTLTIAQADFENINESSNKITVEYWKNEDDTNKITINTDEDEEPIYVRNGKVLAIDDFVDGYANEQNGQVVFVDNDNDGDYDAVIATIYGMEFVVDEKDEENYIISGDGGELTLDPEDDELVVQYFKDGAVATFNDIEQDDLVSVATSDEDNEDFDSGLITIYISSKKVNGVVEEEVDEGEYVISGQTYKTSNLFEDDLSAGDEGVFYLNADGKIAAFSLESASKNGPTPGKYAFLYQVGWDENTFDETTVQFKMIDEGGAVVTKDLASKVRVYSNGKSSSSFDPADDVDVADYDGDGDSETLITQLFDSDSRTYTQTLFKYDTDANGDINKIYIASDNKDSDYFSLWYDYTGSNAKYFKPASDRLGTVEIGDNTIAFAIDDVNYGVEIEDSDQLSVSKAKDLLSDEDTKYSALVYDVNDDGVAACIVVYDASVAIDKDSKVFVVSSISHTYVNDEDVTKVYGYQDGSLVSYILDEDIDSSDYLGADGNALAGYSLEYGSDTDAHKGDVLLLTTTASGTITKVKVLFQTLAGDDIAANIDGSPRQINEVYGGTTDEDHYGLFGYIVDKTTKNLVFDEADAAQFDDPDQETISANGSDVNFYQVDLTTRSISITPKTSLSSVANVKSKDYRVYAYVRIVEGAVSEVVYYKVPASVFAAQ